MSPSFLSERDAAIEYGDTQWEFYAPGVSGLPSEANQISREELAKMTNVVLC